MDKQNKHHEIITYSAAIRVKLTKLSHLKESLKDIHDLKKLKFIHNELNNLLDKLKGAE